MLSGTKIAPIREAACRVTTNSTQFGMRQPTRSPAPTPREPRWRASTSTRRSSSVQVTVSPSQVTAGDPPRSSAHFLTHQWLACNLSSSRDRTAAPSRLQPRAEPAIDDEGLAGDPARVLAGEEQQRTGQVPGLSFDGNGRPGDHRLPGSVGDGGQRGLGEDQAGRDRVDRDAVPAELTGKTLGNAEQGELADGIGAATAQVCADR